MKKLLDWPLVWLAVSLVSVWAMGNLLPLALFGGWGGGLGIGLAGLGIGIMGLAVWQMHRAKTTVNPHSTPSHLVTEGIFGFSRNPIYLGDSLVLLGAVAFFDAIAGIVIVPLFMKVIENRFILIEEARLKTIFPEKYRVWAAAVRRWV